VIITDISTLLYLVVLVAFIIHLQVEMITE